MSCYTPEPADEGATPVSPPEIQSPSRETPYPLSYGMFRNIVRQYLPKPH